MSEATIFDALTNAGMTPAGACALMGNMKAESSMKSNIAQRGMTKLSDEEYTALFDSSPSSCYKDGVGYGLCQWTFWSRKEALKHFADSWGVSVGAEDMQVMFAVEELKTDHTALWEFLCNTDDLYTATADICMDFERPAVNNIEIRYKFAQDFYSRLTIKPSIKPDLSIMLLQTVLCYNGYSCEISGHKNENFYRQLREFVADIGV